MGTEHLSNEGTSAVTRASACVRGTSTPSYSATTEHSANTITGVVRHSESQGKAEIDDAT